MAVVIDEMEVVPREGDRGGEAPERSGPPPQQDGDPARRVEKALRELLSRAERLRAY